MGQFVQAGPVIVDLIEEGGLRRHLYEIGVRRIEGAVAADAEIDARCGDDLLGHRHDLAVGERRGIAGEAGAQTFALRDIEDGEALEEGHSAGLVAVAPGAFPLGLGGEAVGIDHGHPMLALADAAARLLRLPEGQPALGRPAMLDDRAPQDQDIDPRIAPGGERVARQAGGGPARPAPRLDPREAPGFEFGDDPRGHLVIEIGARVGLAFLTCILSAGTAVGGLAHRCPPSPPQKAASLPGRRGWAARRDQEARLRAGEDTVRAERMWSTPKGLASPATGLAGSAARTRRTGRGTDNAAARRRGVIGHASDRHRMAETRHGARRRPPTAVE